MAERQRLVFLGRSSSSRRLSALKVFRNSLAAISYPSARSSLPSASSLNSTCWRLPVSAHLRSAGVEAIRITRCVSSSVCRYASVRHSAEIRQQRLSEGLSPPTPSLNAEYSAERYSHVDAVVLVRFDGVYHIFRWSPQVFRLDLQPYHHFLRD